MTQHTLIRGAGGGGSSGASESSDTVRGTQIFDVLDLISEGECEGLVNGLQSIYFDGVPLQAADGTMNFSGVTVQTTPGTQGQAAIAGVDGVQNEIGVGVTVVYATPVVRSITNPAIDTCRVTIVVPQLSNADASTGNLGGSSFGWSIEVQSHGGGYVEVFRETLSAKTMSRYPRAQTFKLTGPAPWDIKVRRLTPDSTSANTVNAFGWSTYTEIQSVKLRYPNSCLIRSRGSAEQFSRVPVRSFDWLGRRIQVPSNYDPKARVYTGIWDGTFKSAWSDNPAWIYHDMVVHNRYGLGRYITTTDSFKWELYGIGRYCDGLVPDGYGGMEPRFRASPGFETAEQAYKVLTDLAAIFRGIVFWLNEDVSVAQDAPSDPVAHFTRANVVPSAPGRFFAYTGSSNAKRYSSVIIWFNDISQQGKLVPEVVVHPDLEAELGVKSLELSPMGLWSRGQAHRIGQWALYTQEEETEGVGFKVGLDGVLVQPGKVFKVSDQNEAGERLAGRIAAASLTQVQLDADVVLRAGESYTLTVMLPDLIDITKLTPQVRAVSTPPGTTRVLSVATAFTAPPARETVWLLESDQVNATTWRCIGVAETADEPTYTITGIAHQPGKFDLIDRGVTFTKPPVSRVLLTPPAPTAPLRFTQSPYVVGTYAKSSVNLSWVATLLGLSYLVRWRLNGGPWTELPWTNANAVDIEGVGSGLMDAGVRSRNALGNTSPELTGSAQLFIGGVNLAPNSNDFSRWLLVQHGGVGPTGLADALGNNSATRLTLTSSSWDLHWQIRGLRTSGTYTVSIWAVLETAANFVLALNNSLAWDTGPAVVVSGAGYQRAVATITTTTGAINIHLGAHSNTGAPQQAPGTVRVCFLQVEEGSVATQWALAPGDFAAIAAAAQQTADAANKQLTAFTDNNILDRGEKPDVLLDWTAIANDESGIDAQAVAYGITSERSNYDAAITALGAYLTSIGPGPSGWRDTTVDSPIDRTTFLAKWTAVYTAKQVLLNRISQVAGTVANWGGVLNRPQDAANIIHTPTFDNGSGQWGGAVVAVSGKPWTTALQINGRDFFEDVLSPATPSETLYAYADLSASAAAGPVGFGIVGYDAAGNQTQFTAGGNQFVSPGTGWSRVGGSITLGANITRFRPWFSIQATPGSTGTALGTNFFLGRTQPGATLGADWATNVTGAAGVNKAIANAESAATNAQNAADNASQSAATAIAELNDILSDGVLSVAEKPAVIQDWTVIANERAGIVAQAGNYGVYANTYTASIDSLAAYLVSLGPIGWADLSGPSPADGPTTRAKFQAVFSARQDLLNAISAAAKARLGALATLSQVNTPQIVSGAASASLAGNLAPSGRSTVQYSGPVTRTSVANIGVVNTSPSGDGRVQLLIAPVEVSPDRDKVNLSYLAEATVSNKNNADKTITFSIKRNGVPVLSQVFSIVDVAGDTFSRLNHFLLVQDTPGAGVSAAYTFEITTAVNTAPLSYTDHTHQIMAFNFAFLEFRR